MINIMKRHTPKSTCASILLLSAVLAQSAGAQGQTEYTQETQELLDNLALRIQVTAAAIHENESRAQNEDALDYSMHLPSRNKVDLGLELDAADPQNGFIVLSVKDASLAEKLGIEAGDVIVTVNHFEVNEANREVILDEIQSLGSGDSLILIVRHKDKLNHLTLTIEEDLLPAVELNIGPA